MLLTKIENTLNKYYIEARGLAENIFGTIVSGYLTLEGIGRGGVNLNPPSIFLALNFCSLTDWQKPWHNCSLFVKTSFDSN